MPESTPIPKPLQTPHHPEGIVLGNIAIRPHGGETPNEFDAGKGKNVGNSRGPVMGPDKMGGSYHG
jgi:hypothetical protein